MKRRTGIPRDVAQGQSASRRSREHEKRMNIHGGKGVATLVSFYASLRAGNNHREVISILLGGVFAMREKTTAKKNSRCLRRTSASGNKFLSLRSLALSLSLSLLAVIHRVTRLPDSHSSDLLYPVACEISPSKACGFRLRFVSRPLSSSKRSRPTFSCESASTQFSTRVLVGLFVNDGCMRRVVTTEIGQTLNW